MYDDDVCDVTLSVYPHRASLKNMPGHGGRRAYFSSSPAVWIYTQSNITNIFNCFMQSKTEEINCNREAKFIDLDKENGKMFLRVNTQFN